MEGRSFWSERDHGEGMRLTNILGVNTKTNDNLVFVGDMERPFLRIYIVTERNRFCENTRRLIHVALRILVDVIGKDMSITVTWKGRSREANVLCNLQRIDMVKTLLVS